MEFQYYYRNQILTGFGWPRDARSVEHPGGMIDKTRLTIEGSYRVIPLADLVR